MDGHLHWQDRAEARAAFDENAVEPLWVPGAAAPKIVADDFAESLAGG